MYVVPTLNIDKQCHTYKEDANHYCYQCIEHIEDNRVGFGPYKVLVELDFAAICILRQFCDFKNGIYDQEHHIEQQDTLRHYVAKKVVMVLESNTIVNPWAVMVESLNAVSTDRAMPTPGCSYGVAISA